MRRDERALIALLVNSNLLLRDSFRFRNVCGHIAPAPSAPQKIPKDVSMIPTVNFIVFSGTRASGLRRANPDAATIMTAANAAKEANVI